MGNKTNISFGKSTKQAMAAKTAAAHIYEKLRVIQRPLFINLI
jgi:hypothetical protein